MNIIFQVDGGIGKSIMATAVCKAIKTQYPESKLIVISGYPDVFLWNPYVDRALGFPYPAYFYQDYIAGKEVKIFVQNPYLASDFFSYNGHLVKVWCEMFGVTFNGELPELYVNNREYTSYSGLFKADKPIMVIQTNGGGDKHLKYSWARDIPQSTAQQVVDAFAGEYCIAHIRRDDQVSLRNVTPVQQDFRRLIILMMMSKKRLLIDSFAQHMAAALRLPSVVCWIANAPQQFGYDMHTNVLAAQPSLMPPLKDSVFNKFNISGAPIEFPFKNEQEIFDANLIINALKAAPNILVPQQALQNTIDIQLQESIDSKSKDATPIPEKKNTTTTPDGRENGVGKKVIAQ